MPESILVPFAGEGSGVGELSWGQQEIWAPIELGGKSMTVGGATPLPPGVTVEAVAASLRFVVSRHQALRTRFRLDAEGRPCQQELFSEGEVVLEVVDTEDGQDPSDVAGAVLHRYENTNFDYADEWPVRTAIVRHHGEITHMVGVYSHLAMDTYSMDALVADMATMDPATGTSTAPVPGMQPLDQARKQATPGARKQSDKTLAHWERQIRAVPLRRFSDSTDPRTPRFWSGRYESPAVQHAVQIIAARLGVDTSPVLLAGYAVALARVTGRGPSVIQVVVSNRFRPGFADTVSAVNQTGLCVIDVAGVGFDEAVGRTWQSLMGAYKNAYYHSRGRNAMIARLREERGADLDLSCLYNDRRRMDTWIVPETQPTEAELRALLPASTLHWQHQRHEPTERCFLHINDVPDRASYEFDIDTNYVSPADLEALARQLEAAVVEGAYNPTAPTGVVDPDPVSVAGP